MSNTALSVSERRRFDELRKRFRNNIDGAYDALAAIKGDDLWREDFDSWEAFVASEGKDISDRHQRRKLAYQVALLNMAEAVDVQKIGPKSGPISEGAVREVASLPADEQVKVVKAVVSSGTKPTAKALKEERTKQHAAGKISGGTKFDPAEIEAADAPAEQAKPPMKDCLGREVPEHLREHCSNAQKISHVCKDIGDAATLAKTLKGVVGAEFVSVDAVCQPLTAIRKDLLGRRYWTSCPRCDGAGCDFCDKAGWLPESRKGTLSAEDKKAVGI